MSAEVETNIPAIDTIALDFEGVLVSNAWSIFPRDKAAMLLEGLHALKLRIVFFSSAPPHALEAALRLLVSEGELPAWVADLDREWAADGRKDLRRIATPWNRVLLLDDQASGVLEEQAGNWLPVAPFMAPYDPDGELERVLAAVRQRVQGALKR